MRYTVKPGLYMVGLPTCRSPILVTANYKLTFDMVRHELKGQNVWLLVLDTKGINVWCAAGKKTFGTGELVQRIVETGLCSHVRHRCIIVPQLSAPGIDALAVKRESGFRVLFGPVAARDIAAYLRSGYRKDEVMSSVPFPFWERLVLTPLEVRAALRHYLRFGLVVLIFFGITPEGILFKEALQGASPLLICGLAAVFSGAFLTPVALPYIPFRAFSLKGLVAGLLVMSLLYGGTSLLQGVPSAMVAAGWLLCPVSSSWFALQFTGAAPFTSMSGVQRELKYGLRLYIGAAVFILILMGIAKIQFFGGGV